MTTATKRKLTAAEDSASRSNRGVSLQDLVKVSAEDQADRGLYLGKTVPGFQVTGVEDGRAVGKATSVGPLDYCGYHTGRQGQVKPGSPWHVEIECKETKAPSLSLNKKVIQPHQVKRMRRMHVDKPIVFVLACLRSGSGNPEYFAVEYPLLGPWYWAYYHETWTDGKKPKASIPIAVLRAHALAIPTYRRGSAIRLDLVTTIETLIAERTKRS